MIRKIFLWMIFFSLLVKAVLAHSSESVKVLAAGDLMLGSWVEPLILDRGLNYPFVHLDSIVKKADVFFCNLEAPFGNTGTPYEKTFTFRVKPDLVQTLKAGNISVVSLANNHIMDFGIEAMKSTKELLNNHHIKYAGAGINLREARQPARLEIKGKSLTFACYSLTFPQEFWATDSSAGTCFPSHSFVFRDLKKFKSDSDLLIVSFHWGAELSNSPKEYQIELAHQVIDAGADLVLGHHPHVVQGLEIYQGKVIAYSLGNFIFGSYSENARESMLVEFQAEENGMAHYRIYPILVYNHEVEFQPRLLNGKKKIEFFNYLKEISKELNSQPLIIDDAGWLNLQM